MAVLLAALFEHNRAVRHSLHMTKWSSLTSSRECIIKPLFSATVRAIQLLVNLTCALNTTHPWVLAKIASASCTLPHHNSVEMADIFTTVLERKLLNISNLGTHFNFPSPIIKLKAARVNSAHAAKWRSAKNKRQWALPATRELP